MSFSIRTKIILIASTILLFALGANTLISSYVFIREYQNVLKVRGFDLAQNLTVQLDRLLRMDIPLEGLVGFDEQCKDLVEKHDDISYAMVVDLNGTIIFYSNPSLHGKQLIGKRESEIIKQGQTLYSSFDKDVKYHNAVGPVLNISGEHIAEIIIGFPATLITQKSSEVSIILVCRAHYIINSINNISSFSSFFVGH